MSGQLPCPRFGDRLQPINGSRPLSIVGWTWLSNIQNSKCSYLSTKAQNRTRYSQVLKEQENYRKLFKPLSDSEYEDLRRSIRTGGIVNDLIVEKRGDGYVLLSGHHRKAVAEELGIDEVPCSLAETPEEIREALFDNASRRQMTEAERKAKIKEKEEVQDQLFEEHLISEIYSLYKEGKIDRQSIDEFINAGPEVQRSILHALSIERPVVPEELLEQHEQELASMESKHQETMDAERKKLAVAEAEKKKAEEALKVNSQKLKEIRERAESTLAKYNKDKEEITEQVQREVKKELEELKKERETREAAVKAKQDEIGALNGQIESLNNRIYGYDSQVALWRHEVARISELYDHSIAYYSNPALIEVQLQVISEYVEALVRFSECHKWDTQASKIVERYHRSIGDLLRKLEKKVATNQKDVVSLERSERAIAEQGEVELDAVAAGR